MRSLWCFLLFFSVLKCFAWETSETSEALSALIDKLIAQTVAKPEKKDSKYKEVENNTAREKIVNDSNVIYLKLMPNETYNLTSQPNKTTRNGNNSNIDQSEENDPEKSLIERNVQKILNSTNNEDVLNKIFDELKNKISGTNKPEKSTEHKLRIPDIVNSMEIDEESAYEKNVRSGFVDLMNNESPPDILLSKKTIALNNDDNIVKTVPNILTTIGKQISPIDVNDIKDLLKNIIDTTKKHDEKLSQIEHIPSRRRYSSKEETKPNTTPRNNFIRNPLLLGSLDIIPKTIGNYHPLNLCGNCKHLGVLHSPLNNVLNNDARLQEVMRRSLMGNLVNTIRPNLLYPL